jgi:hypothetical protein
MNSIFFNALMDELNKLAVLAKMVEPKLYKKRAPDPFLSYQKGTKLMAGRARVEGEIPKARGLVSGPGQFLTGSY